MTSSDVEPRYSYPKASVVVYTNKLAATHFGEFRAAGFDVKVQRFALRDLLQGTPAEPWLREISAHESGPYYYSHVTDVLRLALLFRDETRAEHAATPTE